MRKIYVLLIFCLLILSVFTGCDEKKQGVELIAITLDSGVLKEEAGTIETAENRSVILPSGDSLWQSKEYSFSGWSITKDGDVKYKAGDKYSSSTNTSLYAVWTANPKIIYNPNGGTGENITEYHKSGDKVTIKNTDFKNEGYTLSYWSTSPDATDTYTIGQEITLTKGLTLYAVWVENKDEIKITFNSGKLGEVTETAISTIEGNSIILPSGDSLWSTDKYASSGWAETAEGDVKYKAGSKYSAVADSTLYAVWTENKATLTYNANGGNGSIESVTKALGTEVTLAEEKDLSRDGFFLSSWTDGETNYKLGSKLTLDNDITLYAVWTENYNIKYYNGNTLIEIDYPQKSSARIGNGNGLSKDNYTLYWTTSSDGTGTQYAVNEEYTGGESVSLYAQWYATYGITYENGDNAVAATGNPAEYTRYITAPDKNQAVTISNAPTRTGYIFKGWKLKDADDNTAETTYTIDASTTGEITLVAVWEDVVTTYSISYTIGDGATPAIDNPESYTRYTTASKNQAVAISNAPTRPGFTFVGWKLDGTDDSKATKEYTISADTAKAITLVAVWDDEFTTYTITYENGDDAVAATGNPTEYKRYTTATDKNNAITISNTPTKAWYVFKGWKVKGEDDNTANEEYTISTSTTGDITLVAVWGTVSNVGDIITLGTYPADEKGYGKYAGKVITWKCIHYDSDNSRALMISEKVLEEYREIEKSLIDYANSEIRTYLRGTGEKSFINTYVIDTSRMLNVDVISNPEATKFNDEGEDRIFLLSKAEAWKYFGKDNNTARIAYNLSGEATNWMLRSPYSLEGYLYCIYRDGTLVGINKACGVRPAFWMSLK